MVRGGRALESVSWDSRGRCLLKVAMITVNLDKICKLTHPFLNLLICFSRQNSESNWMGLSFPSMLSPSSPYQQPSISRGSGVGSNDNFVDEFLLPSSNLEISSSSIQDFRGILSPSSISSGNPENRNQYTYRGDHSSDLVRSFTPPTHSFSESEEIHHCLNSNIYHRN